MLLNHLGRDRMLEGLQEFIEQYADGPDYPLLEDLIATLRPHADDVQAFDAFVEQWFFDVVVPEYRLSEVNVEKDRGQWRTTAILTNHGSGRMEVEVAATRGVRFSKEAKETEFYREARTWVSLGPGESQPVRVVSTFEPEKLLVDPDAQILMVHRRLAEASL